MVESDSTYLERGRQLGGPVYTSIYGIKGQGLRDSWYIYVRHCVCVCVCMCVDVDSCVCQCVCAVVTALLQLAKQFGPFLEDTETKKRQERGGEREIPINPYTLSVGV